MKLNAFLSRNIPPQQTLPRIGSWAKAIHVWDDKELDALALAHASGRPLLIRGEPGIGKSQVARAASQLLGWPLLYEVITARHEAQDLLWHYDAVERLAIANQGQPSTMQEFVRPGILWQALNPASALLQGAGATPSAGAATTSTQGATGTVVLLDEIDKADSDLPNSLLEVLANGGFTLPWGSTLHESGSQPAPTLIIITSNEERELPAAFIRRCICLHLVLPTDQVSARFIGWLKERSEAHFPEIHESIHHEAAVQVLKDRLACPVGAGARPGLAEYIDLLRALADIAPNDATLQSAWLKRLAPYALLKQYPNEQRAGLAHANPRQVQL